MRSPLPARLVSLAALVPLLMLAVSGFGYSRYRCVFTGVASEESCCPAEDAPATPVVNAASCCDHEHAEVVRPPAETPSSPVLADLAAVTCPSGFVVAPVAPAAAPARLIDAVGPPQPPLRLVKQSFLI
jgi:hypothetical protein